MPVARRVTSYLLNLRSVKIINKYWFNNNSGSWNHNVEFISLGLCQVCCWMKNMTHSMLVSPQHLSRQFHPQIEQKNCLANLLPVSGWKQTNINLVQFHVKPTWPLNLWRVPQKTKKTHQFLVDPAYFVPNIPTHQFAFQFNASNKLFACFG